MLLAAATILVLPFTVQGAPEPWAGVAVADALTDHVAQLNQDNFVSLRQLAAVLRRRDLDVTSPDLPRDIARPLGATELVTGTLKREGDRVEIEAHLTQDGKELASAKVAGAKAALPVLARQVGQKLFGATTRAPLIARDVGALELAAQCDALVFQQPLDPRAHGSIGEKAIAAAEPVCRAALQRDAQLALARAGLSVLLTAQGKTAEGLAEAKKAGAGRFVAEAVLAEQFAERRSGDAQTAHAVLEYAASSRPGFLIALGYLGEERSELHDEVSAVAAYDRYLARSPGHPWAMAQKAHALARMGRKDEAVALSRKALEAAPGDPELTLELASRLIDAGKDPEAEPLLRAAAAATPPRPLAGLRLGYLKLRQGKLAEAGDLFQAVVAQATHADEGRTRAVAHADLARVAAFRDDYGAAVSELTAARGEGLDALPCAEPKIARWKSKPEVAKLCAPVRATADSDSEDEAAVVDF